MEANQGAFNPQSHLTKVKGNAYLEVKWRLVWLRAVAPEAKLTTRPISIDEHLAVIACSVELPSGASGSGIGSESPQDFGDYIEKAETKAIGRALATLGFGTQFCDDFDTPETKDGRQRIVDAPVRNRNGKPSASTAPHSADGITERQLAHLRSRLSAEEAQARFGKPLEQLSRQQASDAITQLQSRLGG